MRFPLQCMHICDQTYPLRYKTDQYIVDLNDLQRSVIKFPRLHFLTRFDSFENQDARCFFANYNYFWSWISSYLPLSHSNEYYKLYADYTEMSVQLFQPKNMFVKFTNFDRMEDKCMFRIKSYKFDYFIILDVNVRHGSLDCIPW